MREVNKNVPVALNAIRKSQKNVTLAKWKKTESLRRKCGFQRLR